MPYSIVWSDFAESELDKIFEYYSERAGVNTANRIIQRIVLEPHKLVNYPEMSQREELLFDRENQYYYLIRDNYKIIYSIDKSHQFIKITDVFDTRQNPVKLKRNK